MFEIQTKITKEGSKISIGEYIDIGLEKQQQIVQEPPCVGGGDSGEFGECVGEFPGDYKAVKK